MRLFAASLDVGGPFARSAEDLAIAYDALQGLRPGGSGLQPPGPPSRSCQARQQALDGLRIAVAGGLFR